MTGLRRVTSIERTPSIRLCCARYSVHTGRELATAFTALNDDHGDGIYAGHRIMRTANSLTLTDMSTGEASTAKKDDDDDAMFKEIGTQIVDFLRNNYSDIVSGKLKAVDAGGSLYGIAGKVAGGIAGGILGAGLLSDLVGKAVGGLAEQKGRFFGAAVDDIVSMVKGETDPDQARRIVEGISALVFVGSYANPVFNIVTVGGVSAWKLTKDIADEIGGPVADAIEDIVDVVGDIGDAIIGAPTSLAEDVIDLLGL